MNKRFYEGESAFLRGRDIDDCPYEEATPEYYEWEEGWTTASERYDNDYD